MPANKHLKLIMQLNKLNAHIARRFSVQGLGLGELMVLYFLDEAPDGKLRRVDLAEKLGLTASGVTRMLVPMEKIGLVKRAAEKNDARISYAMIAPGGKRMLDESMERAELLSQDILGSTKNQLGEIVEASSKLK